MNSGTYFGQSCSSLTSFKKINYLFWQYWALNARLLICWEGALTLEPYHKPLFSLVILEIGCQFLPRRACTTTLLFYTSHHSWDDRQAPPQAAFFPLRWTLLSCLPGAGLKPWSFQSQVPKWLGLQAWATSFSILLVTSVLSSYCFGHLDFSLLDYFSS
jgi:hypothetical protein